MAGVTGGKDMYKQVECGVSVHYTHRLLKKGNYMLVSLHLVSCIIHSIRHFGLIIVVQSIVPSALHIPRKDGAVRLL